MAITRFQALVSRESMAEVFTETGRAATVVEILNPDSHAWSVVVEYGGMRKREWPSRLSPSRALLALIDNGTYCENEMKVYAVDSDGNWTWDHLHY